MPFSSGSIGRIFVHCCFKILAAWISNCPFSAISILNSALSKLTINSSQDIKHKTLDYRYKVINFLQALFCKRYVCLEGNYITQQKVLLKRIYFVLEIIFLNVFFLIELILFEKKNRWQKYFLFPKIVVSYNQGLIFRNFIIMKE